MVATLLPVLLRLIDFANRSATGPFNLLQAVPQIGSRLLRKLCQPRDNLGMLVRHIGRFAEVRILIV